MKIVVGIDGITNVEGFLPLIDAGADEFYVGYIPEEWNRKYGFEICPNRRPYPHCNYRSAGDLEKACAAAHKLGKKIYLAVNEHEYAAGCMAAAVSMLRLAETIGFDAAIVSNIALMIEARSSGINIPFTISIGGGASNVEAINFYLRHVSGIKRIILPRSLAVHEIKEITENAREKGISLEAFVIGDPCVFNDEYCFSWHSGKGEAFCAFLFNDRRIARAAEIGGDWKKKSKEEISAVFTSAETEAKMGAAAFNACIEADDFQETDENSSFLLRTVRLCGLCSLRLFNGWGIEAVKVPARGGIRKDELIRLVKKVVDGNLDVEECRRIIGNAEFCSGTRCYYNYPSEKNAL